MTVEGFRTRMEDWFLQQMMQNGTPQTEGAAPSPTPQERNQRGQGYRLNPYEQDILGGLNAGVAGGLDPQVASQMLMGLMGGAMERRQQNVAQRQEGMAGLQELAMQLAAQGASPDALASSVSGMAGAMPGMNGPRGEQMTQGLVDYVYGMYPGGSEVSGLAPYDYRQQFATASGLDQEDRGAIGSIVVQGVQSGVPMKDIREQVRRELIASGYDPAQMDEGMSIAEQTYEQLTGASLSDVRMMGDLFRNYESTGSVEDLFGEIDNEALRGNVESLYGQVQNPTGMLGMIGSQPGALSQLANDLRPAPAYPAEDQGWNPFMTGGQSPLANLIPSLFGG